jgi:peroxiredoxin
MTVKSHLPLFSIVLALAALALPPRCVRAAEAADFPPGPFNDGGHYSLKDFEGKVVVLFFYEQDCPKCRGLIPERNKVVEQFKGKPVKFIAIGPGDTLSDVKSYVRSTQLKMPVFADTMGVMQHRYGQQISLRNIYQFRVIGPDGNIVANSMKPADIEKALEKVKWKYKDGGYDPKLNNIIELLEWNQYAPAVAQLKPLMKGPNQTVAASATKLYEAVKAEGQQWMQEAEKAKNAEDPVKAYDLYSKVSAAFAGDDLAKAADAALKPLRTDKTVLAELSARKMYDQLNSVMANANPKKKQEVAGLCHKIATQYPQTPTGKKAAALADQVQSAPAAS